MGLQGTNLSIENTTTIALTSPTATLQSLPTKNVSSSGLLDLTGFGGGWVNFIARGLVVTLKSTSLVTNASYSLISTGGSAVVQLDNGGTIGGQSTFTAGGPTTFRFDGTNLV